MGQRDIPLNSCGIEQAHNAVQLLRNTPIRSIISSSLDRAKHTAEIISSALKVPFMEDENLKEASLGVLEGQPKRDKEILRAWKAGGTVEGVETYIVN